VKHHFHTPYTYFWCIALVKGRDLYIAKHSVLAASLKMPVYLQGGTVNSKVKSAPGHTMKARGGSGVIAPLLLNLNTKCTSGQLDALAAFLQGRKPMVPSK